MDRLESRAVADQHQRPTTYDDDAQKQAEAARAPTHAERCRTLVRQARAATLCTLAVDPAGYPYGSLVTIAFDDAGRPLFLLSNLAEHTTNLKARAEASVLVSEPLGAHDEPLALGRITILGRCERVDAADVREMFLAQQPSASYYVDFADFAFYRLEPEALRYVGGFGRMSWVDAAAYRAAEADPLADAASGILKHMNDDHADILALYAQKLASMPTATSATMTAVDRYGFDLAVTTPAGKRTTRLAFDTPVATTDEVRRATITLATRAREAR